MMAKIWKVAIIKVGISVKIAIIIKRFQNKKKEVIILWEKIDEWSSPKDWL